MHFIRPVSKLTILFLLPLTIACSSRIQEQNGFASFDLVKLDSIEIASPEAIHGISFNGNRGVVYNFLEGSLTLFDTTGAIIKEVIVPTDGSGSLAYIGGLKLKPNGQLLLQTVKGEIALMDEQLNLQRHFTMPFQPVLTNMRSNVKSMDIKDDDVYIYFPGRDGGNPFERDYLKNNHLLEKVTLSTGATTASLKLPPESKFQQEAYFDIPYILVAIRDNVLHFALDNEPFVHLYDLNNQEELIASIPLDAKKFVEVEPKVIPLGNTEGVLPALIDGIFPLEDGFAVSYGEGLKKEELDHVATPNPQYLKSAQNNILKIYREGLGWSNEVVLPDEIAEVLNFEGVGLPFYALRNNVPLGISETNTLTIYRLMLTDKQ